MKKLKLMATFLLFNVFNSGCANMKKEELNLVEHVDIQKYMGDWYVIGNIPLPLEGSLVNAIESYSWNEKENRIDILYQGRKESPEGELKKYPQKGFIHDKTTNAEWRVQFFWPLKFSYLIHDLAPDYSYVIVGVPSRKYLWIMGRKPLMDEKLYQSLVEKSQRLGYDTKQLRKVQQSWPQKLSTVK